MESGTESKAIICESEDRNKFTVKNLTVKQPGQGQVRVQMKYATFSKHDTIHHAASKDAQYPFLAGYDGVGTIDEVGEGVEEFNKGDHVAVFMVPGNRTLGERTNLDDNLAKAINSGKLWSASPHLQAYSDDNSIKGFKGLGTWSQLAVFPASHLVKLEHEPQVADAGLGSVFATGLLGPSKIVDVEEGTNVAVFGSNSLALTLVTSLKYKKPESIVVIGASEDQEFFDKLGVKYVVDKGEPDDIKEILMDITKDGYDYTFEATNFKRFGRIALEICHKGWGKCVLLTAGESNEDTISTRPFQLVTGRHWVGSYMGNVNIAKDQEDLLKAHHEYSKDLVEHLFPEDHVVNVDEFPDRWQELSKSANYHRIVIKF